MVVRLALPLLVLIVSYCVATRCYAAAVAPFSGVWPQRYQNAQLSCTIPAGPSQRALSCPSLTPKLLWAVDTESNIVGTVVGANDDLYVDAYYWDGAKYQYFLSKVSLVSEPPLIWNISIPKVDLHRWVLDTTLGLLLGWDDNDGVLLAYDTAAGVQLWNASIPLDSERPALAMANGTLYGVWTADNSGWNIPNVFAFNYSRDGLGAALWQRNLSQEIYADEYSLSVSPDLSTVYVVTYVSASPLFQYVLYAIGAEKGVPKWQQPLGSEVELPAVLPNGNVLVSNSSATMLVDQHTGALIAVTQYLFFVAFLQDSSVVGVLLGHSNTNNMVVRLAPDLSTVIWSTPQPFDFVAFFAVDYRVPSGSEDTAVVYYATEDLGLTVLRASDGAVLSTFFFPDLSSSTTMVYPSSLYTTFVTNDSVYSLSMGTPCSGKGVCQSPEGRCACNTSWYNWDCSVFCDAVLTCSGHGACIANGSCTCNVNYYAANCSVFCNAAACEAQGGGRASCGAAGCTCFPSYYPTNKCDTFCDPVLNCSSHGSCAADGSCSCAPGYYTTDCSVPCNSVNCVYGTCLSDGSCQCDPHRYGDICALYCEDSYSCNGQGHCTSDGLCDCDYSFSQLRNYGGDSCSTLELNGVLITIVVAAPLVLVVFAICLCQRRLKARMLAAAAVAAARPTERSALLPADSLRTADLEPARTPLYASHNVHA